MIAQEVGDRHREGQALHGVGVALTELGEFAEAEKRREALLIRREVSDQPGRAAPGSGSPMSGAIRGAMPRRKRITRRAWTRCAVGDRYHEGLVLWQMGVAAQQQGAELGKPDGSRQ